jgi:hypothetical protein
LNDSSAVAEVDERQPAKVAASMDPTAKAHMAANVAEAQRAAEVCTMGCREMFGRHQES